MTKGEMLSKRSFGHLELEFGIYLGFGVWSLGFHIPCPNVLT